MDIAHPQFVPDATLDRSEMEKLQREIAATAVFEDNFDFSSEAACREVSNAPRIAGVDQAFVDDSAVSAVVVTQGDDVIEEASAVVSTDLPYIPGLLSFREGQPILAALAETETDPDLLLVDGNGRLHYRQAGLATHIGVTMDLPTIGVAKGLLCGRPADPLDSEMSVGERVPIVADDDMDIPNGTRIGTVLQTRQFERGNRHVNPVYVSPGHRVGNESATDIVAACCRGYKLPEPIRAADAHADAVKTDID